MFTGSTQEAVGGKPSSPNDSNCRELWHVTIQLNTAHTWSIDWNCKQTQRGFSYNVWSHMKLRRRRRMNPHEKGGEAEVIVFTHTHTHGHTDTHTHKCVNAWIAGILPVKLSVISSRRWRLGGRASLSFHHGLFVCSSDDIKRSAIIELGLSIMNLLKVCAAEETDLEMTRSLWRNQSKQLVFLLQWNCKILSVVSTCRKDVHS